MKTGVYTITNLVNNKIYVGSAAFSFSNRWAKHRRQLRNNIHDNKHLQRAWNKYGESSFKFEILETCNADLCVYLEQYWLNMLNSANELFGYNIRYNCVSNLGLKHTEETKLKMSQSRIGRKMSTEAIKKMSDYRKGKPNPRKGVLMSDERKLILRETRRINYFNKNGYYPEDKIKYTRIGNVKWRKGAVSSDKCVIQLDLNNVYIQEFKSIKLAQQHLQLKTYTGISNCCNNRVKTASGFKWKFKYNNEGELNNNIN
jgi:group I intron endonuclease